MKSCFYNFIYWVFDGTEKKVPNLPGGALVHHPNFKIESYSRDIEIYPFYISKTG